MRIIISLDCGDGHISSWFLGINRHVLYYILYNNYELKRGSKYSSPSQFHIYRICKFQGIDRRLNVFIGLVI